MTFNTTSRRWWTRLAPMLLLTAATAGGTHALAQPQAVGSGKVTEGPGWRLIDTAGQAGPSPVGTATIGTEPTTTSTNVTGMNTMMWEVSRSGVASLPVSDAQKQILYQAFDDDVDGASDVIFISQELLEAMESPSFPAGYEQYIDQSPASVGGPLPPSLEELQTTSPGQAQTSGLSADPPTDPPAAEITLSLSVCDWKSETRNRAWDRTDDLLDREFTFSDGVEGHLKLNVPLKSHADVAATYKIRRCLGVPVGFKFVSATASGNASLTGTGDLQANVGAHPQWKREWKIAEPQLGDVSFTIGWIPVRLVFTLPINAGAEFTAKIAGNVSAQLDASATGSFSYTCTTSTCSGTSNFTKQFQFIGPSASATVDLTAKASVRMMLRVSIYTSDVAYVEGGVKPYAQANLWGYVGNTCGDADGNGTTETVEGLAADLIGGYQFAYGMGGWLLPDKLEYTGGREYLLGWRDLLGASTALQPMLLGPATIVQGQSATYTVKMRPCYPYAQAVNFMISPGTWTGTTTIPAPPTGSGATMQVQFAGAGPQTVVVTPISDTFGRDLHSSFSRAITVTLAPPVAPSALAASLVSTATAHLTWADNSDNESGFEVERRVSPAGAFALVGVAGANVSSLDDMGLQAGTTYEYRVRATNGAGASGYSNTAGVTTAPPPPAAPSGLSGSFDTATRTATLTWIDNSSDEDGFLLQYSVSGGAFADFVTVGANVTRYTSGPNPPPGAYQVRVRAFRAGLYSEWSNVASVTVTAPPPTASIAWIQTAETTWGPVGTLTAAGYAANGTGGVQLVWREQTYLGVWGAWTTVAYQAPPQADTTWSNTISSGIPTDKCHWFDAYVNYSGVQSPVFHYTGAPGCPAPQPPTPIAPSGLAATLVSTYTARLTWTDNSANETGFEIERRVSPAGAFALVGVVGANISSLDNMGLGAGTTYEYRVRATNGAWASAYSNLASVTTAPPPPAAPSGLSGSFDTATRTATLTWIDNSSDEDGFLLQYSVSGGAFADFATLGANVTRYTSAANPPPGAYQVRVRAFKAGISSGWSTASLNVPAPPPTVSIAWIQPAESTWGPAGTLTAAGFANNGSGGVQLVWREQTSLGNWSPWTTVAYQAPTMADGSWSNTISSGSPTDKCHWFDAYVNYSGMQSPVFHYQGAPGCPPPQPPSASIYWIQPAENAWGPWGTLTAAGFANNGSGGVQLVWREQTSPGTWGPWISVAYAAPTAADGSWSNTISSGNPTDKCHWFDAYVNYSGVQSPVFHYQGAPGCPPPQPPSASIYWIQPAENAWGPWGTLTAAGFANNGSGGVQLVWREQTSPGTWGPWITVAYAAPTAADGSWSNTISSGNPTDKCHWFDAYVNYSGVQSPVFHYTGAPGCP